MLNRLKTSLFGLNPAPAAALLSATEALPAGFYPVLPPAALTGSDSRQRCLQMIAQTCSMSGTLYDTLCYRPLITLLHQVQQVPAAEHGPWARQGGFGDLTLQYTACAVRLAKGYMFPPGEAPEVQSAQSAVWHAVVLWSAMFRYLPLLARLEGELLNGEHWLPGMTVPAKAYRCRFRASPPSGAGASAQASLMAVRLLPSEAVSWLSSTPRSLYNLAGALWNGHPEMTLIRDILRQAAEKVDAPSLASVTPAPAVTQRPDISAAISAPAEPVSAVNRTTPDTVSPPGTTAETDMLLSELATSVPAGSPSGGSGGPDVTASVSEPETTTAVDSQALSETDTPDSDDGTDMLLSLFSAVPEAESPAAPSGDIREVETPASNASEGDDTAPGTAVTDDTFPVPADSGEDITDVADPAVSSTEPVSEQGPEPQETHLPDSAVPDLPGQDVPERAGANQEGEAFLHWLKESLRSGQLPVNGLTDRVHIVAGHVFLPVPGIFFEYLKQTGKEVTERERIQREFEQLNICKRRDNRRYWFAHQQQDEQGKGGYKKRKGYLVRGRQFFTRVPQDSPYLSFP